jgi:hypothetical protein
MSSDNGFIIRVHPNGGFAALMYFQSAIEDNNDWPKATPKDKSYPSIQAALNHGEYSEYGTHLDDECQNIQSALLSELHEDVLSELDVEPPNYELNPRCSCGERSDSWLKMYKHQADTLREQLKTLGG